MTERAKQLRDQVLKTWDPPLETGNERPADIAQTAVMQTLEWCYPLIFDGMELTEPQRRALRTGKELFEEVFK